MSSSANAFWRVFLKSEPVELIQEPFKEAGAKTGRFKNDIGGDFDLGQIPVMV